MRAHLDSKDELDQELDEGREALMKTEMETEVKMKPELEAGSKEEPKDESLFWLDFKICDAVTEAMESDPSNGSVASLENDSLNDDFRFIPEELIPGKRARCNSSDCTTPSIIDRTGDGLVETCMQHPLRDRFRRQRPYTLTMRDF